MFFFCAKPWARALFHTSRATPLPVNANKGIRRQIGKGPLNITSRNRKKFLGINGYGSFI